MSHFYIVIDCCPSSYVNQKQFTRWLDSMITFCNSHLMVHEKNDLTVVASFVHDNHLIFSTINDGLRPTKSIIPQDGQFERFAFTSQLIRDKIIELLARSNSSAKNSTTNGISNTNNNNTSSSISSENHLKTQDSFDCALASALGIILCRINKTNLSGKTNQMRSRILVASCSIGATSFSSQYMNLMNSFFAAQKMNVPIDGCIYMRDEFKRGSDRGSLIEQGCDLTGGHFLNLPDISGNLEYLLWIFLPDAITREHLLLPEQKRANHRAVCFCHRKIIDIGYVCSVCLSIFCKFYPICSSCQTHFKLSIVNNSNTSNKTSDGQN